jgi:DNA modification methylase
MIDQGWLLRNTIIWHKRSCTPSPVKDRFTVDYELFFFFTKSGKYYFKTQFEPLSESYKKDKRPKGVMRNKFYENSKYAQPYNADGSAMFDETISLDCKPSSEMSEHGRIKRSVWSLKPQPLNVKHFATFPEALIITPMRSCVPERVCAGCGRPFVPIMKPTEEYAKLLGKSWTPEQDASSDDRMNMGFNKTSAKKTACGAQYFFDGYDVKCSCNAGFVPGIALDPFMGSGTVGVVAKKLERSYIGFEINSDYINIATERINSAVYGDITITEEL